MLALRSRGLGSAYTTLHLHQEAAAAELLGIPDTVTQCALHPGGLHGRRATSGPRRVRTVTTATAGAT